MKKGMSINSLMKHMRTNHGMEDLRGSDRKILLRNMGYFHGYKGFRFVRKPKNAIPLPSFDALMDIYGFDSAIKAAIYPEIMFIETAVKNIVLARILENIEDPGLATFLRRGLRTCRDAGGRVVSGQMREKLKLKSQLQNIVRRSYKNDLVKHYVDRDDDAPVWSIFEVMTLGDLTSVCRSLPDETLAEIASDLGFSHANPGIVVDIVETIRPLRNAVAHNGVVFDSRFSQSVKYTNPDRNLAAVGELLDEDLSIGYRLNFNSIVDYIVLLAYLLTLLTYQKKRSREFLRKCLRELEKLESAVGVDTYMMIVGSGDRQKYRFIEGFIDGYGRKR